jgi:hypothetical protein
MLTEVILLSHETRCWSSTIWFSHVLWEHRDAMLATYTRVPVPFLARRSMQEWEVSLCDSCYLRDRERAGVSGPAY